MAETGLASFDRTLDKTNHVLKEIERAYGWPKERRNQSYDALRGVLHAVRDRLPVQETAQLAAQLPMLVRGIYYEAWDPSRVPVKMKAEEFVDVFIERAVLPPDREPLASLKAAASVLRRHVTEGETEDVVSSLPIDIRRLLE